VAAPFPLQHGDLLSEGEDFKSGIASTTEEDSDGDDQGGYDFGHEHTFKQNFARQPLPNRKS
jgi:hypothetical protein